MEELWVPIVAIICTIGLPIATGLILGFKKINSEHKERMGLINQGIIPPDSPKNKKKTTPNRFVSLRNGIILVSLGVGIIVGFLLLNLSDEFKTSSFFSLIASIVFFLGLGYLTYFFVTRKMEIPVENGADFPQE